MSVGYEVVPNKYVSFIANHACRIVLDDYFEPTLESVGRALETVDKAILEKIGTDLTKLLGRCPELVSTHFKASSDE